MSGWDGKNNENVQEFWYRCNNRGSEWPVEWLDEDKDESR